MAITTRQIKFVINMDEDRGPVIVNIDDDGDLAIHQDDDMINLDHSGARALVDAINELFPDA